MKNFIFCLALGLGALAAGLGTADLSKYQNPKERIAHPVWALVSDQKVLLVILLTAGSTIPALGFGLLESRKRKIESKDLIIRYLQLIHTRSFPHVGGGMCDKHRVSLFTARERRWGLFWHKKKRELSCLYRTDSTTPKKAWDLAERHGLVVNAWLYQATFSVEPPTATPEDNERYLREAWMNADIQQERSWRTAGMKAVPLLIGAVEPIAILLVESVGPQIACSELTWDAKTLTMLLGGR